VANSTSDFQIVATRANAGYLLDTGVLFAIADRSDQHHAAALDCLKAISNMGLPIYVSIPTIHEAHRRILHGLGIARARDFLESIFDGNTNIVAPSSNDEFSAIAWIDYLQALRITLTDAVNMAIMTRLSFRALVSFDSDFLSAGLARVPPLT